MHAPHEVRVKQREEIAWRLRAKGYTYPEIADEIEKAGLGRMANTSVCAMVARVEKRALKDLSETVGRKKMFASHALMYLYREATKALEASKIVSDEDGNEKILDHYTDPKFSAEARAIIGDFRKLWGLDAPTKMAPTTPDGEEPYKLEIQSLEARLNLLSVDQLRALMEISEVYKKHGIGVEPSKGINHDDNTQDNFIEETADDDGAEEEAPGSHQGSEGEVRSEADGSGPSEGVRDAGEVDG